MAKASEARVLRALLRNNFTAFVRKVFVTLESGQAYVPNWHLEAIAYQLERVGRGEIKRLIINMPPRSLKSMTASVAFPAFVLGHNPARRIICVSYSGDLAKKHANDFRAVLQAPWYQRLFERTRIGQKDSETEIELTARGFRLATSVGGTLTGRGGDLIVIDDPLKPDDAYSEAKRNAANEWFKNTLLSRLDDKRTGAIIIVMQRVHMDDLTGFVTSQSDEWEILNLPAIAEVDEVIPISDTKAHRRRVGEALSPVREPLSVLENMKVQLGSDAFSAQYQQMPVPPGGATIKRHWIKRYKELPLQRERSLFSKAGTPRAKVDRRTTFRSARPGSSAATGDGISSTSGGNGSTIPSSRPLCAFLPPDTLQTACSSRTPAPGLRSSKSCLARSMVFSRSNRIATRSPGCPSSPQSSSLGLVFLPERAAWLADFEAELFAFPGSRHDDQCDSVSQALSDDNCGLPMVISPEAVAASRIWRPWMRRYVDPYAW